MPKFKVWSPDFGDTEDDAVSVDGFEMEDAAEEFAETLYSSADHFDAVTIHVQGPGGNRHFRVSVDFEPRFYASDSSTEGSDE